MTTKIFEAPDPRIWVDVVFTPAGSIFSCRGDLKNIWLRTSTGAVHLIARKDSLFVHLTDSEMETMPIFAECCLRNETLCIRNNQVVPGDLLTP